MLQLALLLRILKIYYFMNDLRKSLLVTGTSRGLGKLIAEHYLKAGEIVFGCSRSESTINNENYHHFVVDLADEVSILSMFKEISARKIRLDLLINNAGVTQSSLGILTGSNIAREIVNINFLGTFFVTREALKIMQRQRYGRVINFSSINVPQGSVGSSLYNGCKAAINALALPLSRESGTVDITINTIGLSLVNDTGMLKLLSEKAISDKQRLLVKPDKLDLQEIIHAINFFSSPLSRNISSQTLYFGGV